MKSLPLCLVLALSASSAFAADAKPSAKEETIQLAPLKVSATPSTSFPIALEVLVSKETRKVLALRITEVEPDSEAAYEGLQVGDEIVKINDRPVVGMDGHVNLEAELAKLLLNRPNGEKLKLEVLTKRSKTVMLRATTNPSPPRR